MKNEKIDWTPVDNWNYEENDRIIFVGAPSKEIPAETWRIIDQALMENRVITFDYQKSPCAIIASATLMKPAIFAPATRS